MQTEMSTTIPKFKPEYFRERTSPAETRQAKQRMDEANANAGIAGASHLL